MICFQDSYPVKTGLVVSEVPLIMREHDRLGRMGYGRLSDLKPSVAKVGGLLRFSWHCKALLSLMTMAEKQSTRLSPCLFALIWVFLSNKFPARYKEVHGECLRHIRGIREASQYMGSYRVL